MKKRLLCMLLALVMVLSMLPVTALAAADGLVLKDGTTFYLPFNFYDFSATNQKIDQINKQSIFNIAVDTEQSTMTADDVTVEANFDNGGGWYDITSMYGILLITHYTTKFSMTEGHFYEAGYGYREEFRIKVGDKVVGTFWVVLKESRPELEIGGTAAVLKVENTQNLSSKIEAAAKAEAGLPNDANATYTFDTPTTLTTTATNVTVTVKVAEDENYLASEGTITVPVKLLVESDVMYDAGEAGDAATDMPDDVKDVEAGTEMSVAGAPSWTGHEFLGWSTSDVTVAEDGTFTVPEKDVTFTAKWKEIIPDTFTVKFMSNGSLYDSQSVTEGGNAVEPKTPEFEDDIFLGWYLDDEKFVFTTPVSSDIELNAKWIKVYTVTFDSNKGSAVEPQYVAEEDIVVEPEEPTKDGFIFDKWYLDGKEYDFKTPVTGDITLKAEWTEKPKEEIATTIELNEGVEVTYGDYSKSELMDAILKGLYDANDNELDKADVKFVTDNVTKLDAGTQTVTVRYNGSETNDVIYLASEASVEITVNKAAADVTVNSQTIKYSELDEMLPLVEKDNVKTIDLLAGLDVHDETYLLGTVQVAMELSDLEKALIKSAGIDINNITLEQFKKMLGYLGDSIESVGGLLEDTNIDMDTIKSLVDTLQSIQAQLPMDSELRIQIVDELKAENIGVYLVGSVVADNNYETALDAGYLIITPNGLKAELSWAETDDNDIITLSKLEGFNLSAEVKLVGSTLEGADASVEEAEKHLEYYYIGVDADGELLLEQTMTEEVGVYAQIAYIANWDNEMYYAMPIARPIIVAPNVADVDILDENGNENYLRAFTYDGSPKSVTVTVDGEENVDGLTVKYIGSDTRVDGWYREEAPTESGVYTVVAIYTEKDDNGNLIKAGGAVGAMVIEPADAEFTLTNDEVCPDGEEHFAKLEDDMGFDYLTIAIDRDRNEAYVNLPDDTAEHIDRIVSMLPAEIEEPLNELLDKYADFDGDVQTSTLKNEVNGLIQKVIDADTSAMAVEYAEKLVALVADELENNEEIKALVEKLQSELDAIQTQIEDKLPDELEDYIKEIVSVGDSSIDVNVEKVEADVKALLDQMKDSIPEEVYNELYEVAENLINAVKNNSTVQELQSQVEDILAKVEELENVDAETIVKGILGAAAGAIDGEELAALVEEVIAKIEARGYVDYAKNLLKDIASMYKGEVDVDGYIDAVENEAKELLNKLKEKVASGDISMDDLEDVESYVDGVLAKIQELVNKIPEGTIIFGSNPSEVGEYDCYAMNISANYKPVFQSATLIIGHDMVAATSKEPTCTEDGYTAEAYCKRCQQYVSETIPALGHDWSETAADNGDGTHTHVCGNDSTHTNVEAHVMGAWVTTVTATTTREGEKRRDCAHCDYYETKTIPMIEEEEEWYEPEVEEPVRGMRYLNKKDHMAYIIGYEDGTVRPNDNITRAEVATIYFRLLEDKVRDKYWSVENPYEDVAVTAWYNTAVSTLHNLGVIVDCETEFRPNDPITRAELAVMAAQFAVIEEYERCSFEDVGKKYWAADEIAIVEAMGWIEGYPDGTFLPDVEISRAEAVTIINRMLERAVKEEDMRDDMVTFSDNLDGRWYFDEIQEAANSHKYKRTTEEVKDYGYCYERWTRILEAPDWALIEQGWYARHAA